MKTKHRLEEVILALWLLMKIIAFGGTWKELLLILLIILVIARRHRGK